MKTYKHKWTKTNKFNAKKTDYKNSYGITRTYDSKLEARRATHLDYLLKAGEVVLWLPQPVFYLPGGVRYVADFQIFWADGRVTWEDTKGKMTTESNNKIKQVLDVYNVEIEVVKK